MRIVFIKYIIPTPGVSPTAALSDSLPQQEGSFLAAPIRFLVASSQEGLIKKVGAYVLAFFVSMLLLQSWIGVPVFVWGLITWVQCQERMSYNDHYKRLNEEMQTATTFFFQKGRCDPLSQVALGDLPEATRQEMIAQLQKIDSVRFADTASMATWSDRDLLQQVALIWDDYLQRFHLAITPVSTL